MSKEKISKNPGPPTSHLTGSLLPGYQQTIYLSRDSSFDPLALPTTTTTTIEQMKKPTRYLATKENEIPKPTWHETQYSHKQKTQRRTTIL
jgi:hypothetical protein